MFARHLADSGRYLHGERNYMQTSDNYTEKPRILVVEDNPTIATIHAAYCKLYGYEVDVVHFFEGAISRLKKTFYSFVLLDLNLCDYEKDGWNIVEEMKKIGYARNQIIICSDYYEYEKHCNEIGIIFLRKPLTEKNLEKALKGEQPLC